MEKDLQNLEFTISMLENAIANGWMYCYTDMRDKTNNTFSDAIYHLKKYKEEREKNIGNS